MLRGDSGFQESQVEESHTRRALNASPPSLHYRLNAVFAVTPASIMALFVLVLSHSLLRQCPECDIHSFTRRASTPNESQELSRTPDLQTLLADVADALDEVDVTYWLMPGLGLFPPSPEAVRDNIGRFNPWQEGADIGVLQNDIQRVILAQTALQASGIVAVETHCGLRLFPLSGRRDDRYDFSTPFVDILYFKQKGDQTVNFCCDCAPTRISACTKKMCNCISCPLSSEDLFPLSMVTIESVRRKLSAPKKTESLLLPKDIPGIHPLLFGSER